MTPFEHLLVNEKVPTELIRLVGYTVQNAPTKVSRRGSLFEWRDYYYDSDSKDTFFFAEELVDRTLIWEHAQAHGYGTAYFWSHLSLLVRGSRSRTKEENEIEFKKIINDIDLNDPEFRNLRDYIKHNMISI